MNLKKTVIACVLILFAITSSNVSATSARETWMGLIPEKFAEHPAFAYVENDPGLPNVLLYGDSISIGYTPRVKTQLKGEANVYRLHVNGNHSGMFIKLMTQMHEAMRSDKLDDPWAFEWDVIHFNVGLHDLKFVGVDGLDKKNGKQVNSLEQYKKNLHAVVAHLRELAPQAKLIFAATTPVPEGEPGRIAGDARKYNQAAAEVLEAYPDIAVNDLHAFVKPHHKKWWTRPGNVHYNDKGNLALGNRVSQTILKALPKRGAKPGDKAKAGDSKVTKSPFVQKLESGEAQTIVVYGTSLTNSGQWRRQFAAVLAEQYGDKAVVKNAAKSGSDSVWGLKNIDKQVFPYKPDVLFIEFSMNDAITKRGISIEKASENLESMIAMTRKQFPACEVILMSMNPSLRSGKTLQRPKLAEYYDSYRAIAKEHGLQFVDNHAAWVRFFAQDGKAGKQYIPDGIHPNGLGARSVITPNILTSIGVSFEPDDIPIYPDPPPKQKKAK